MYLANSARARTESTFSNANKPLQSGFHEIADTSRMALDGVPPDVFHFMHELIQFLFPFRYRFDQVP